jgi:spoIIIJ-associated protein
MEIKNIKNFDELREEIKKETKKFFDLATFESEIIVAFKEDVFFINVKIDDPKIIIGERGQTLIEVQHLLRILLRKKLDNDFLVELDINDYKKKKEEALREVARDIADEVIFYKKEKILPPMSSYERRIIHLALKDREDIFTESIDDNGERRVVVKPE